jgi:hypothetical protein
MGKRLRVKTKRLDIEINVGSTRDIRIRYGSVDSVVGGCGVIDTSTIVGYDLSGKFARMHVRDSDGTLVDDLTTENGRIELGVIGVGYIGIKFSESDSLKYSGHDDLVYDLELYGLGIVERLIEGTIIVYEEVTHG